MCIALLSIYQRHPYNCGFETDMIYYSRSLICTLNVRNSDEISASIKPCPFWYCVHFGWDTSFRLRKFLNIAQTFSGHVFNKKHFYDATFYHIGKTIYHTPYNIIFSIRKLALNRYLQHFFFNFFQTLPLPTAFFWWPPPPAYDILGCTTDPPLKSKLEQP